MEFIKDLFIKNELKDDTPENISNAYEIAYYSGISFLAILVLKVVYPLFYLINSIFSFYVTLGIFAIAVAVFVSIEAKYNKETDELKKSFEDLKSKIEPEEKSEPINEEHDPDDEEFII